MKVALAASLGLNLLVVGAIGGVALRGGPEKVIRNGLPPGLTGYVVALPEEKSSAIRQALRQRLNGPEDFRRQRRAQMEAIRTTLLAPDFDAAAFARLMAAERAQIVEVLETGHAAVLTEVSAMTLEERAAYVERLNDRRHRGGKGPKRD